MNNIGPRLRLFAGITVALLVIGFAIGRSHLSGGAKAETEQASAPPAPLVSVMVAKRVEIAPTIDLPGTVVAREDSKLASEVDGRVAWVADVGTKVAAGDVVARLDPDVARMQLDSDKANVARLAASLKFNRDQAERMDRLFAASAIAKATRDQAVSTRDMTMAELNQARAALATSQYRFDHSEIRAPFPGSVAERLIRTGEYATPGKEIVRLVDIDSIEVKAQAPIDIAHALHEGMVIPVAIQGRTIRATVRAVVPVGDELSRTIEVRLTLPQGSAFTGDAANVYVPSTAPRKVIAVPRDALVLREDGTFVYTVTKKDVAERVSVQTGANSGAMVEVKGRIAEGERVIVRGAENLEAGQKVRVGAG
jgi:RND family efflux transporter MFP subunit